MILKRGNLSALFLLRFPGTKKAALSCGGGCDGAGMFQLHFTNGKRLSLLVSFYCCYTNILWHY